jgi:Ca2+-binding RTX toxin-like protein
MFDQIIETSLTVSENGQFVILTLSINGNVVEVLARPNDEAAGPLPVGYEFSQTLSNASGLLQGVIVEVFPNGDVQRIVSEASGGTVSYSEEFNGNLVGSWFVVAPSTVVLEDSQGNVFTFSLSDEPNSSGLTQKFQEIFGTEATQPSLQNLNQFIQGTNDVALMNGQSLDEVTSQATAYMNSLPSHEPTGDVDNDFSLTIHPDPESGQGAEEDDLDLEELNNLIEQGTVIGGPTGTYRVTYNDPVGLNQNTADNTADAAATQVLVDGNRPGNQNLATAWNNGTPAAIEQIYAAIDAEDAALGAAMLNNGNLFAQVVVPTDPLVLDLNGDGVHLTDYTSSPVLFDADHDGGSLEQTGWVDTNDGIVVHDLNSNGVIDGIHETLSEYYNGTVGTGGATGTKPFANGFAALKSLDSNSDNVFNFSDAAFGTVRVWVDANHDGKSYVDTNGNGVFDAGIDQTELKTLSELNITSINLVPTLQSGLVRDGNEMLAAGTFIQNGQTKEALAANFLANPNGHTLAASGNGTVVSTQGGITSYVSNSTSGETIDVAAKGVDNAYGGTGNDVLIGDASNNWLAGGLGSDTFNAGAGDDVLLIDANDLQASIHAGAGTDIAQVVGDAGVTFNLALAEVETAQGGRGNDILIGGGRSSVFVRAGEGDDIVIGGAANDALSGEDGADLIDGGQGNDVLRGHRGRDTVLGGAGDDLIQGGQDDDRLSGGAGNDVLKGEQGDDAVDGGDGTDVAEYSGSYADYRITRTDDGVWISDTVSGRDGTDFLKGVEKLNFRDVSLIEYGTLNNPLPVKDVLTKDANNNVFDRASPHLISKAQLLGNDIDYQGDTLRIVQNGEFTYQGQPVLGITDVQGGTATLTAQGDVLFTPDPNFRGIMGFKYTIADSGNHLAAEVNQIGTANTAIMRAAVYLKTPDLPADPLATDQWYLTDANILPVWKDYTGKGVRIGQFEPGGNFSVTKEVLDFRHPDLQPNIDATWLANATPGNLAGEGAEEKFSTHATLVAGVMVASKNGEGAVGVAYDAKVAGYWIDNNGLDLNALKKMAQYDVANNSWTARPNFVANFDNNPELKNAFEYSVANGRNGLGTAIVMAGGNERAIGGNANYLSTSNNRFSITAGAINAVTDLGTLQVGQAPFSNPGASILVSAPGSNVTSTSRIIENDNGSVFGNSYEVTQGTSFADVGGESEPRLSGHSANPGAYVEAVHRCRYRLELQQRRQLERRGDARFT